MPLLLLLRHATAALSTSSDLQRPLTAHGRQQAADVGRHVRASYAVEQVLTSPAVRARQTVTGLGLEVPITVVDALYNAGPDELLTAVREQTVGDVVLLVAHNPGLFTVAVDLLAPAAPRLRSFPPGALCVVRLPTGWPDLRTGTADLVEFWTPQG